MSDSLAGNFEDMSPQITVTDGGKGIDTIEVAARSSNESFDTCSQISEPSTIQFEHEPFETFKDRVLLLCRSVWPNENAAAFKISRMEGGSYNRVVGITYTRPPPRFHDRLFRGFKKWVSGLCSTSPLTRQSISQYVIRIPRYETAWVEQEIAMIRFLNAHTRLPVPSIMAFDLTKYNPLRQPYSIQPRISGENLIAAYPKLNIQQKISFASQYGQALAHMHSKSYSCAGVLDPNNLLADVEVSMLPINVPPRDFPTHKPRPSPRSRIIPQTTMEFLGTMLQLNRDWDIRCNRSMDDDHWEPLGKIAHAMNDMGLFDDNRFYLTHMDLEPRNLLVDIKNNDTAALIDILDWDSAVFAPRWMGCKPPSWLWDWQHDDDEDKLKANETPVDPGMQQVKQKFEDAVGQDWLRYAYTPEYRIARNIGKLLICGINRYEAYELADSYADGWEFLHPFPKDDSAEQASSADQKDM